MKSLLLLLALLVPTIAVAQPAPISPAAAGGAMSDAEFAAHLPLPVLATIDTTGLATSLGQTTGNVSLASIDAKLTNPLPVSGTITFSNTSLAVTNAGTFAVQAAQSGTWNIGSITTLPAITFASPQHVIADSGTITAVTAITNALPAGSNLLGKVGIDQTTPGTTNAVAVTNGFGLEATLQSVKTAVETIDNCISGSRCLVTEDNSALIKTALDTLNAAVATAAKQDTGNTSLGSIKTNTDPLVASGAGGYVRQDSTATIAKESGGNLATLVTNTTGLLSAGNSSSATLAADATFSGTYENVKGYAFFSLSVYADQSSAASGLAFDWSHDGVNTDRTESSDVTAATGRAFALVPRAQYFRVRYTNGSVAQSAFRIGVVYHPFGTGILTKPLDGAVTTENFGELVQAPMMAKNLTGTGFSNVLSGIGGSGDGVPRVTIATDSTVRTTPGPGLPLAPCNAVRRTNCQAKGY